MQDPSSTDQKGHLFHLQDENTKCSDRGTPCNKLMEQKHNTLRICNRWLFGLTRGGVPSLQMASFSCNEVWYKNSCISLAEHNLWNALPQLYFQCILQLGHLLLIEFVTCFLDRNILHQWCVLHVAVLESVWLGACQLLYMFCVLTQTCKVKNLSHIWFTFQHWIDWRHHWLTVKRITTGHAKTEME